MDKEEEKKKVLDETTKIVEDKEAKISKREGERRLEEALKKVQAEKDEIQKKLDDISTKQLEEKEEFKTLYEKTKSDLDKVVKQTKIQEALNKEKINPEFSKLVQREIEAQLIDGVEIDQVMAQIKTEFPSAFTVSKAPVNIGTNVSTSPDTAGLSKEEALKIIVSGDNDAYNKYQSEIQKALEK